jgi:hypothetical protein
MMGRGTRERARFWWNPEVARSVVARWRYDGRLNMYTPVIVVDVDVAHDIIQVLTFMGTVWVLQEEIVLRLVQPR